jgi:hypothetical protein
MRFGCKTYPLMQYWEIVAVCSESHTEQLNTLCGNVQGSLNVRACGTYIYHWVLNGECSGMCQLSSSYKNVSFANRQYK